MAAPDYTAEVLARFGSKHAADLGSVLPAVAGAPIGSYLGYALGNRYGGEAGGRLGGMLGAVAGGTLGKVIGDSSQPAAPQLPPGAPFNIDPTVEDIPPWAVAGAQFLSPMMRKTAENHNNAADIIFGEVPGYSAVAGHRDNGWRGALTGTLGQAAGGVLGGLAGHGIGSGIEKLVGHGINVPGINMPLHELLAGIAGSIGATKGFRAGLGR